MKRLAYAVVGVLIILAATSFAWSKPQTKCLTDQRTLFLKAIEKIMPLVKSDQNVKPEHLTYESLLPDVIVGRYFVSFATPDAFLDANPDCCSLHDSFIGFEFVDPTWFEVLFLGAPELWSENLVVVHINVRASAHVAGKDRAFKNKYDVVLDRCARELNVGRFDISRSGTLEER